MQYTEAAILTVCSSSCDSATIQGGINLASSGDEVRITDSRHYNESVVVNVSGIILTQSDNATIWFNSTAELSTVNVTANSVTLYNLSIVYNSTGSNLGAVDARGVTGLNLTTSSILVRNPAPSSGTAKHGVFFSNTNSSSIYNSTIDSRMLLTGGSANNAVRTISGYHNVISYNTINSHTFSGGGSNGVGTAVQMSGGNNTINNNTIKSGSQTSTFGAAIHVSGANNSYIVNNSIYAGLNGISCSKEGITLDTNSINNTIEGNYVTTFTTAGCATGNRHGIRLNGAYNTTISNNTINIAGSGASNYGIYIQSGRNNTFSNIIIKTNKPTNFPSSTEYGVYLTDTNNTFFDVNISSFNSSDIFDANTVSGSQNYFVNSTFPKNNTGFSAGSVGKVFIQYRLDATVRNASGDPISGATVFGNDTDSVANLDNPTSNFTATMNSSGQIPTRILTEFMANLTYNASTSGTGYLYFNNHTVNFSTVGYEPNSTTLNVTNDISISFVVRKVFISIGAPTNTTYNSASIPVSLELLEGYNVSVSVDGGSNTIISSPNTTFSDTIADLGNGAHRVTFYANSTAFSTYETVFFTVDAPPQLSAPQTSESSGGGLSTSPSVSYDGEDGVRIKIPYIIPNYPKSVKVNDSIPVKEITMSTHNTVRSIGISIKRIDNPQKEIAIDKVYTYIEIDKDNILDSDIKDAVIRFDVNRSWVRENKINTEYVGLYRYNSGRWNSLRTDLVSVDKESYTYEAVTPGFSTFAIAGNVSELRNVTLGNTTVEKSAEGAVNRVIDSIKKPTESPLNTLITIIVFAATIVILYCAHHVKTKTREYVSRRFSGKSKSADIDPPSGFTGQ